MQRVAIIGAGPAGLACAEVLADTADAEVVVFEQKPSAARKFLMAGKTGLNISHAEPFEPFISRYTATEWLRPILQQWTAQDIQQWMLGLGIDSYVGSSGRIFPNEMKAAPLLRAWLQRLQQHKVQFRYRHQITALTERMVAGIDLQTSQRFSDSFDAIVLACGAVSWPQLGSDGAWQQWIDSSQVAPFQASNAGVLCGWSQYMQPYHGLPLKRIQAWTHSHQSAQFGEMVISHYGLEGGLVYRCNRGLRQQLQHSRSATLYLDLLPDSVLQHLQQKLQQSSKQSLTTRWQKIGLDKSKIALLREIVPKAEWSDSAKMARQIKQLAIEIQGFRPIEEAISCAGGIRLDAIEANLKLKHHARLFACGEMLDWDAPTGGYLLTACLATGRWVGQAVAEFLQQGK